MINYCVFDKVSGEITKTGICTDKETALSQALEGDGVLLENASDSDNFVDTENLKVKEKNSNPATIHGATLNNLPCPCTLNIFGRVSQKVRVDSVSEFTLDDMYSKKSKVVVVPDDIKYKNAELRVSFDYE